MVGRFGVGVKVRRMISVSVGFGVALGNTSVGYPSSCPGVCEGSGVIDDMLITDIPGVSVFGVVQELKKILWKIIIVNQK